MIKCFILRRFPAPVNPILVYDSNIPYGKIYLYTNIYLLSNFNTNSKFVYELNQSLRFAEERSAEANKLALVLNTIEARMPAHMIFKT